jgi:xanthine dehydrogenase accessory factor
VATHAGAWEEIFSRLTLNDFAYILIATRGHKGDLACLRWALTTPARFIGMIGSRRKLIEFTKVLVGEGVPASQIERIHSPAGIDIGALTPEEIAVAVVAELIAVRRSARSPVPSLAYKTKAQLAS